MCSPHIHHDTPTPPRPHIHHTRSMPLPVGPRRRAAGVFDRRSQPVPPLAANRANRRRSAGPGRSGRTGPRLQPGHRCRTRDRSGQGQGRAQVRKWGGGGVRVLRSTHMKNRHNFQRLLVDYCAVLRKPANPISLKRIG